MNIANRLTMLRILLTFVFMFFLFMNSLWAKATALLIYIFAAVSDFLDGRIAQKHIHDRRNDHPDKPHGQKTPEPREITFRNISVCTRQPKSPCGDEEGRRKRLGCIYEKNHGED